MSQEMTPAAVKTVLKSYEAIRRRDIEAVLAVNAWDVVIETRVETHRGHDGATKMLEEAFASEFTDEPEAMLIEGNRVVALTKLSLTGGMTGIETEQELLEVWTLNGDDLISHLQVIEREEGLESLGLTERASRLDDIRASYEAFNRGAFDEALNFAHPDIEVHRFERSLNSELIRGRDQLRAFFEPDIFESQQLVVEGLIATERRVLVKATIQARTSGTGIEVSTQSFQVWTLRDWRAERADFFQGQDEALALLLSD